jgi:hypothetical protein
VPLATIAWNKLFEIAWRALVFIVAAAIIAIVLMNWNRWEGGAGWQRTNVSMIRLQLLRRWAGVGKVGTFADLPPRRHRRLRIRKNVLR